MVEFIGMQYETAKFIKGVLESELRQELRCVVDSHKTYVDELINGYIDYLKFLRKQYGNTYIPTKEEVIKDFGV